MEASTQVATPAAAPQTPTAPAPEQQQPQEAPKPKEVDHELEWAKRFNALSKKEKMMLDQRRHLEEQRKEIAAFHELKKLAQENPTELFSKLGISYDDVTNYYLNDGKATPEQKLKAYEARLAALETERLTEKQQAERAKEEAVISNFKSNIKSAVSSGDKYELTNAQGEEGIDLVFEVVDQLHQETGKIELERALELVEAHLEKNYETVIKSAQKLKKFFPSEEAKADIVTGAKSESASKPLVNTLTHQATTTSAAPTQKRMLTDEESKAQMAELLRQAWSKQG